MRRAYKFPSIDETGKRVVEYSIWWAMKDRCNSQKCKAYGYYGGRGIKVCERWNKSFQNFMEDMGYRPSKNHSLERVDNNKGYSPENCKWATIDEQSNNKSNCVYVEYLGMKKTLSQWAKWANISYSCFMNRISNYGWSFERAITTPTLPIRSRCYQEYEMVIELLNQGKTDRHQISKEAGLPLRRVDKIKGRIKYWNSKDSCGNYPALEKGKTKPSLMR